MSNMKEYTVQGKKYRMRLFERITSPDEAYLIGYMLGDGGFNRGTHKRKARMFLTSTNKELIYEIQKRFIPDTEVSKRIPINKKRPEIKSKRYSYKIQFPAKYYNTFNKFGLMTTKDKRTYHNIPRRYMPDMVLGLFDADGHMSWGRRKDRNRLWVNWTIAHPNLNMLTKLQRYLAEEIGINSYISPRTNKKVYDLKLSHREEVIKLCDYLYEQSQTDLYNQKKYNHFQNFKEEYTNYYK